MTTAGLSYWREGSSMTRKCVSFPCPLSFWLVLLVTTMLTTSSARVLDIPSMNFRADGEKEVVPLSSRSLDWFYPQMIHRFKRNETETETTPEPAPIRLCGYRLLDAVKELCGGRFVTVSRRSDRDIEDERRSPLRMQGSSLIERLSKYFLTNYREQSQNLSPPKEESRHFRYRRNLVNDCCMKPCTTSRMQMYCEQT